MREFEYETRARRRGKQAASAQGPVRAVTSRIAGGREEEEEGEREGQGGAGSMLRAVLRHE